ncbi:hypothetical protein DL95DRAFT_409096 [Leptodontidium sp. 2 PMI_412]|nr:hypothetical protein DL95DRAFT_409096 [Leptodontidium sp. 2 PMI_412]
MVNAAIKAENTRKKSSRRSIHKGGSSATVRDLREKIRIRDEAERVDALRKAQKALDSAIRRHNESLRVIGVQARKENREKKRRVDACRRSSDLPAPEDLIPDREPDKSPNPLEAFKKTPEGHPEYLHIVLQLQKEYNRELEGEEVQFRLGDTHPQEGVGIKYIESSPPPPVYVESSNVDSDEGSIDSITRNADFVAFN